jgi:hypothetical protein
MPKPHAITLGQIRDAGPCGVRVSEGVTPTGFGKLLIGLGEPHVGYNRDRVVTIGDVAIINGMDDALWCLRCVDDRRARVRAIMPAVRRVSKFTTGSRVHACIAAIDRWLAGNDTVDLQEASDAARSWRAAAWSVARSWRAASAASAARSWRAASAASAAAWLAEAAWSWRADAAASRLAMAADAAADAAASGAAAEAREREAQLQDLIKIFGTTTEAT